MTDLAPLLEGLGAELGEHLPPALARQLRSVADDSPALVGSVLRLLALQVEAHGPAVLEEKAAELVDALEAGDTVLQLQQLFAEGGPDVDRELTAIAEQLLELSAADRRRQTKAAIVFAAALKDLGVLLARAARHLVAR